MGPFQLFKLSKLCYHFLLSLENENNFFLVSLAIPRPSLFGIHWPINFTKKIKFLYIKKTGAKLKCREGSRKNLSLFFLFLKIYRIFYFLPGHWEQFQLRQEMSKDQSENHKVFDRWGKSLNHKNRQKPPDTDLADIPSWCKGRCRLILNITTGAAQLQLDPSTKSLKGFRGGKLTFDRIF